MNKKGQSPYIIIGALVVLVLILGGYIGLDTLSKTYDLQNLKAEKENLGFGDSTRIFFDVKNNADLTFLGKIEVIANETCFSSSSEELLSEIQPKSISRSSVYLRVENVYGDKRKICEDKPFEVAIKLKDVSGTILDQETITIGISE